MSIFLKNYKVISEQSALKYSVVSALPNVMINKQGESTNENYTWNFVTSVFVKQCEKNIEIEYDFSDSEFIRDITFEDKLIGTLQWGDDVLNAEKVMSFQYNEDTKKLNLTIKLPVGKTKPTLLSWNIFINDGMYICSVNGCTPDN